jgi:hypothetical protein
VAKPQLVIRKRRLPRETRRKEGRAINSQRTLC